MTKREFFTVETPAGRLGITLEDGFAVGITATQEGPCAAASPAAREVGRQLGEWFAGTRAVLAFPFRERGTDFQRAVWAQLRNIPRGQTRTYAEIARAVGRPKAFRAVGGACHRNPLLLLTPCHRVVAASGPGGFGCGLPMKRLLLRLEGAELPD